MPVNGNGSERDRRSGDIFMSVLVSTAQYQRYYRISNIEQMTYSYMVKSQCCTQDISRDGRCALTRYEMEAGYIFIVLLIFVRADTEELRRKRDTNNRKQKILVREEGSILICT